jgi:CHAT domain-containing protein
MGRCRAPTSSRWWRARVLHFAGHVRKGQGDLDGGFVLHDGIVTAADLKRALGKSAPLLVFANGCHASTSEKWAAASSLAQALLLAGVRHTLAQMWAGPDADALSFALRFYEAALAGVPFGECARDARGRPSPPRTRRRSRSPATCSTASRARSTGSASAWRRR